MPFGALYIRIPIGIDKSVEGSASNQVFALGYNQLQLLVRLCILIAARHRSDKSHAILTRVTSPKGAKTRIF